MAPKSIKKHYVSSQSWWRFTTLQNIKKPLVKQRFGASKKLIKIPYKTCRLWRLLRPFSRNGFQKYQKSIRFSVKVDVIWRLRKTSKKHWLHNVLEHPEKLLKIPYKTCRLWGLLRPFSRNGSQKYQKAIGFSVKVDVISRLRKTSKKHWLHNDLEHPKTTQNTL